MCARHFNQDHLAHSPTSGRRMTTPKRTRSTTLVNGKDSIASWHYKTSTTSTRRPSSTESTPARITARDLIAPSPPISGTRSPRIQSANSTSSSAISSFSSQGTTTGWSFPRSVKPIVKRACLLAVYIHHVVFRC